MLKIYNSLTRKIEEFKPIRDAEVGFYSCGPTVYDYPHIGNLRSFVFADLLRRTLKSQGFAVNFVMNLTDVDDKTIKRSQDEHKPLSEVTEFYTQIFLDDLQRINIETPDKLPKATEEIDGIVALIGKLLEKGFAYKTANGDIYFAISKFPDYGKLAQVDLNQLRQNAEGRLNNSDEYEKEDARDFALWKAYSQEDGDVFWETEIGKGRPGWHIECSVMSSKYLGQPFDIHAGGIDLIFPHHTNEMAQSEAAYDKPLANYWVHPEHLLIDNAKMAKSKNNFFTSKDVLDKGFDLLAFRYLVLTAHYRSKLNFSWESLAAAQNALNNLYQEISAFDARGTIIDQYYKAFLDSLNNDLDTPSALAILHEMLKSEHSQADKLATLFKFDEVLGLKLEQTWKNAREIPEEVTKLINERNAARENKDFAKSDELRQTIESMGYVVEDTTDGMRVKKKF